MPDILAQAQEHAGFDDVVAGGLQEERMQLWHASEGSEIGGVPLVKIEAQLAQVLHAPQRCHVQVDELQVQALQAVQLGDAAGPAQAVAQGDAVELHQATAKFYPGMHRARCWAVRSFFRWQLTTGDQEGAAFWAIIGKTTTITIVACTHCITVRVKSESSPAGTTRPGS